MRLLETWRQWSTVLGALLILTVLVIGVSCNLAGNGDDDTGTGPAAAGCVPDAACADSTDCNGGICSGGKCVSCP